MFPAAFPKYLLINSSHKRIWSYMYLHCKSTEIQIRNRIHSSHCKQLFGYLAVGGVGPIYESVGDWMTGVVNFSLKLWCKTLVYEIQTFQYGM